MNGKLKLITDGQVEPITLEEARLHLRLDTSGSPPSHPDDSLVTVLITVARQSAEAYLGRSLVQQTYELALDRFPNPDDVTEAINLQVWPVRSITSVQYQDEDDASQTVDAADYVFDTFAKPAELVPLELWPGTKNKANAVKITFVAGHTDNDSPNNYPLPLPIKQAMLLQIGQLYEFREAVSTEDTYEMPMGSTALLTPYRISMGL
jgi:uncharacterized phiE125 gp8 family phage protein